MRTMIVITSAMVLGAMQSAVAQTDMAYEPVPYTITFDGAVYPSALEEIDYPYAQARLGVSGSCLLNVLTNSDQDIAGMTIESCSNASFRVAARNFIDRQTITPTFEEALTAHRLTIVWSIGEAEFDEDYSVADLKE